MREQPARLESRLRVGSLRRDALGGTAPNHITNILAKLAVHSQLQAVRFALRYDAIEMR